jgi:hypothetical protein
VASETKAIAIYGTGGQVEPFKKTVKFNCSKEEQEVCG